MTVVVDHVLVGDAFDVKARALCPEWSRADRDGSDAVSVEPQSRKVDPIRRLRAKRRMKTEPLLDPLRQEPRFKAIQRELKFPP